MTTLILTVIGDDRPGLVSTVSAPVSAHAGNWERSRMARLAGKFAGIVQVSAPDARVEALVADLVALAAQGLQVTIERTDQVAEREARHLHLELLGADHAGIVAEVSIALAELGVSIEELSTDVVEAPMAGGRLFQARASLVAPAALGTDQLRLVLEQLAHDLMVDVRLSD